MGGSTNDAARTPFLDRVRRGEAGRLGIGLFLASIGVLFLATIAAFLTVRFAPSNASNWQGVHPPNELLLSTALLAGSSLAYEIAMRRVRRGNRRGLLAWLRTAFWLGCAFLLSQAWCWARLLSGLDWGSGTDGVTSIVLAAWFLVVLTALHAIHVVGGLAPMALSIRRAVEGRYTASRHDGLSYLRAYWHFLGAVWLVLLATILLTSE